MKKYSLSLLAGFVAAMLGTIAVATHASASSTPAVAAAVAVAVNNATSVDYAPAANHAAPSSTFKAAPCDLAVTHLFLPSAATGFERSCPADGVRADRQMPYVSVTPEVSPLRVGMGYQRE